MNYTRGSLFASGILILCGCDSQTLFNQSAPVVSSAVIAPVPTPTHPVTYPSTLPTHSPTGTPSPIPSPSPSPLPSTSPSPYPITGVFPAAGWAASSFFLQDVSGVTPDPTSTSVISWLSTNGGWGAGAFKIDFSINVLIANASTPHVPYDATNALYPDSDMVSTVPLPVGGALEGSTNYSCDAVNNDCHLIVIDPIQKITWEQWASTVTNGVVGGAGINKWDMQKNYPANLRGDQCTSADAAGFPIAPMTFTADEVASGSINHAIRFILPNTRMAPSLYVHPATHGTRTTGGANAPIYGSHFRLRADYPVASLPSAGAQVVARALQKYGMFLADGGNIALTADSDQFSVNKWGGMLGSNDLTAIQVSDFEVMPHGAAIPVTFNCVRNP